MTLYKENNTAAANRLAANPSDILHRLCYNNFPKFYFTAHFECKEKQRQDTGNESTCYFSGILVHFFFTAHGTSAKI